MTRIKNFAGPGFVWLAGLILIIVYAPRTVHVSGMVGLGFFALCIGTYWALYALYREYDRTGKELPPFIAALFPDHPAVDDYNGLTRRLSGFRQSYSGFLSSGHAEQNSALQNYATQLLWHSTSLQKRRLMRSGLTMEMDSVRRAYTGKGSCVRENRYFDGRYQVNDVYEEISALRTFRKSGRIIGRVRDDEVAHYTLLSANQIGGREVVCPNCGSTTTRENLLDGCDYCGTRFTVEDMKDRVDSFGLRRDFRTNASKRQALMEAAFPWTTLAVMLPLVYFGLVGAFVYMPGENILIRLVTGLLAAGLLGLLGWCLKTMFLYISVPFLLMISLLSHSMDRKIIYRHRQEEEQERKMAEKVRQADPLFSIQSFFGGVQNKISAIHYADSPVEVNAFSESDMSALIRKYKNVVETDCLNMTMHSYQEDERLRRATVSAELRLLELRGQKIRSRNEKLKLTMIKDAACRTQAVCGVSVLQCGGCGASLSLLEGRTCRYCGRDLDLKKFDWVIEKYETV